MLRTRCWLPGLAIFSLLLVVSAPAQAADTEGFPSDTSSVLSFNIRQVMDSPLVKMYLLDEMKKGLAGNAKAQQMLELLELDPFKDLDRVTVAAGGSALSPNAVFLLKGNFKPSKLNAALGASDKVKSIKSGSKIYYEMDSPNPQLGNKVYLTIVNEKLIAAGTSEDGIKAMLAGKSAKLNSGMAKLMEGIDEKASMYLVAMPSDEVKQMAAGNPDAKKYVEALVSLNMNLNIDKDIKLSISANLTDEDLAKELSILAEGALEQVKQFAPVIALQQQQLAPLAKMAESLKSKQSKKSVIISAEMSGKQIEQALKSIGN